MFAYLITAIPGLLTTAIAVRGWRRARREVNQFRALYWTVQRALREETGRKDS